MVSENDIKSDDVHLLAECIKGSRDAWDLFVKRFSKLVLYSITKTFRSYTKSYQQEDVEDLFNSIFLSLIENNYKKLRKFESQYGCSLSSWIRLISIRYTIDFLRCQKKYCTLNHENNIALPMQAFRDDRMSVVDRLEWDENEKNMKKVIEALPHSDKLFLKLYYEKELSPDQIAEIMNVSVNTIYSKKNRIREKIKKILEDKGFIARN